MPAASPLEIVSALLNAFAESGTPAVILSGDRVQPRRFILQTHEGELSVWVYAWTLTHGGRASLPDEYRIQMTSVASPLPLNPEGLTLLLGFEPNLKVFGGFDIDLHRKFTAGSPSVQIDINCLRGALQDGLSFYRKTNEEIAVGIRPDQLFSYLKNAPALHRLGRIPSTFKLLEKASSEKTLSKQELGGQSQERKKLLLQVMTFSRDANFRQQVLRAYDQRCAVTRAQLKLVDAAHILPVKVPGSTDDVRNGLALSPTVHRAFDNALIFLGEDLVIRSNPSKVAELTSLGLDGGLQQFKALLGRRILLPPDQKQWPNPKFIREANKYRKIGAS